jgi:hypothetical protein
MQRETEEDMATHALGSLQRLAPSGVRGFKPCWAPPLSTPQFLADETSPCYVRSLPDFPDVRPSGHNTFLMMYGFNRQEVSVGC